MLWVVWNAICVTICDSLLKLVKRSSDKQPKVTYWSMFILYFSICQCLTWVLKKPPQNWMMMGGYNRGHLSESFLVGGMFPELLLSSQNVISVVVVSSNQKRTILTCYGGGQSQEWNEITMPTIWSKNEENPCSSYWTEWKWQSGTRLPFSNI